MVFLRAYPEVVVNVDEGQLWCGGKGVSGPNDRPPNFILCFATDQTLNPGPVAFPFSVLSFQLQKYGVVLELSVPSFIPNTTEMGHGQ